MAYETDWLTSALSRKMLEDGNSDYTGAFVALDVKRTGEEISFSDGDRSIYLAVNTLRKILESKKVDYELYRYGGDEFVLITTEIGLKKIKKSSKSLSKCFYFAVGRKSMNDAWVEAFDRAWSRIKKLKLDKSKK